MTTTQQPAFWLWPDHVIGKRESRRLREEHNRAVNDRAELLELLIEALPYIEEGETFEKPDNRRARPKLSRRVRALIARARGEA